MKHLFVAASVIFCLLILTTPSFATNGSQLIGVGSNQKGMGGAVTAAPEDAMTAISNPAGMALIGSRADFNGEAFMPKRSMDFKELPAALDPTNTGDEDSGGSKLYGVPSLGWTAPAFDSEDTYFGGGFFAVAGMGVDYDHISAGGAFGETDVFSLFQFAKIAPTVAWNVNEKLALGVSLDLDYQLLEIRQVFEAPGLPNGGGLSLDLGRAISAYGGGFTLGAIYKVNDMVTLGAAYISKQWFQDLEYRLGSGAIKNFPDRDTLASNTRAGTYRLNLDFPQQAAVGIAVKPMEALTLALDVKWINWEDTYDTARLTGAFTLLNTNTFASTSRDYIDLPFGWDNQVVIAVGAKYQLSEAFALRFGYNWAESPIDEEDVFNNIAFPAIVESHATFGFSYEFGPHWGLSGSYMHAFQNSLSGKKDVPKSFQNLGFPDTSKTEIELSEDSVGMQISYRF